jgi:DNA-binding beta-propeller fold protein YncE
MKITRIQLIIVVVALVSFATSCIKDEEQMPPPVVTQDVGFVVNEGNFGSSNGSISAINFTTRTYFPNYFEGINGFMPGDIVQSMRFIDPFYFIVVNNSGKIEVTNGDLVSEMTIDGLTSPRYIREVNDTLAYVSHLYTTILDRINPLTGEKYSPVEIGYSSEQMEVIDDKMYIVLSTFPNGKIGVFDLGTESLVDSISLEHYPGGMVKDKNDNLWIVTSEFQGASKLYKIDPGTISIELEFTFGVADPITNIGIDPTGDNIYYGVGNSRVYKTQVDQNTLEDMPVIEDDEITSIYGIAVRDNGNIYVCDSKNFSQEGSVLEYNETGVRLADIPAGIGPNSIVFAEY